MAGINSLDDLVGRCNVKGWRVVNLFQVDRGRAWRARMQRFTARGASTEDFAEADGGTAVIAVEAAFRNGQSLMNGPSRAL